MMTFRFMNASHTEITTTTVYVQCTLSTNSSLDCSTLKLSTASHGHVTHEYSVTLQQVMVGTS